MNIVRTDFTTEGTFLHPEPHPRVPGWLRRFLRHRGWMRPVPAFNLFQSHCGAFRFETADGRAAIVLVPLELVNQDRDAAERYAREVAIPELRVAT